MRNAKTFDPGARLSARNANSLAELQRQFGYVGLVNGPRVGPNRRTTASNEAYLVRRLVLHLASTNQLTFPVTVEHGDAPDFVIWHGGERIPLEVTEACPPAEGRASALEVGPREVSNYSELGTDQALSDLHAQIQAAIDRKSKNAYASEPGAAIMIYPNSDASMWVSLFERSEPLPFLRELRFAPFTSLYVIWSEDRIYSVTCDD